MSSNNHDSRGRDAITPTTDFEEDGTGFVRRIASLDFASFLGSHSSSPALSNDHGGSQNTSLIQSIEAQIRRGSPVNFGTLGAVWDALKNQNGVGLDDRKYMLEEVLVFMSRLPPGSQLATQVEHFMIDFLYKDLPHPPCTFLGPLVHSIPAEANGSALGLKSFAYRQADGSCNNPLIPELGAAHTPYARSVTSSHVVPISTLPDPGLVFDTLLKRDRQVDHPTGLSSMFFAFANLIIHSLFHTNRKTDSGINDTSSYLDLSPLYGVDQTEQDKVRRFDGTGRLWDDVFADARLLGMPPSTAALLIVFNRNHNFVATRILNINERRTYSSDPLPVDNDKLRAQDNEIFNRARLVIMRDYVGCILRMIPDLTPWHLRPLDPIRDSHHEITPRGEGNACSVEFNLLYRWHATTSTKEEKWLDDTWKRLFPNKTYDEITARDFGEAVGRDLYAQGADWSGCGRLRRNETTGRFDDDDLARILQGATADSANAFRARGIPAAFKIIEIMGIQQARAWGVCSLNEFRTFLGLKPYTSFKEWNSKDEISQAAEQLYHNIDNMELYVGMQAEEARPSIPGSGLCSGFTMSRSILADAVALIRGDRFLTVEYTPFNLTSWGYQDVETTDDNGSLGGMLTKLLFRTLPQHYTPKSIYAHFPFIVPSRMRENMQREPSMIRKYDWLEPHSVSAITPIQGLEFVREIVTNTTTFLAPYQALAQKLTDNHVFYFDASDSTNHRRTRATIHGLLFTSTANSEYAQYCYEMTRELFAEKSYAPARATTRTVDIVREVINVLPLYWLTTHVVGLPLRTKENPHGKYSEQELYGYFAVLFTYIYRNNEPVNAWFLEYHSRKAAKSLLDDITAKINEATSVFSSIRGVVGRFAGQHENGKQVENALYKLLNRRHGEPDDEGNADIVCNLFGVAINSVANWAHAMTHVVNFYLEVSRKNDKDAIVALAGRPVSEETENLLIGYVQEALRIDPPASPQCSLAQVAGVLREARANTNVQTTELQGGERVFVNLAAALVDEGQPGGDALAVNPRRPQSELSFVPGAHSSLDQEFSNKTMAHVLRAVFGQKNLRRAPGESGQLTRFTENLHGTSQKLYIDTKGQSTSWPYSMHVQFDI
ncbi:heme peroxidase [Gautieria morchelliformis]|nr:heme peroxidase [Gautieria morchelliformis]